MRKTKSALALGLVLCTLAKQTQGNYTKLPEITNPYRPGIVSQVRMPEAKIQTDIVYSNGIIFRINSETFKEEGIPPNLRVLLMNRMAIIADYARKNWTPLKSDKVAGVRPELLVHIYENKSRDYYSSITLRDQDKLGRQVWMGFCYSDRRDGRTIIWDDARNGIGLNSGGSDLVDYREVNLEEVLDLNNVRYLKATDKVLKDILNRAK